MKKTQKLSIAIIGGGPGGCFLAILLAQKGFQVDIYERLSEKDTKTNASRRSFNITLYEYAAKMLKQIGLWRMVNPHFVDVTGIVLQEVYTENMKYLPFHKKTESYAIDRVKLLELFIKKAQSYGSISFHFNTALVDVDTHKKTIRVQDVVSKKYRTVSHNVVFGADGVNSIIRKLIPQRNIKVQESSNWSYKQIRFTKEDVKKLDFRTNTFYLLAKKNIIFLLFPHNDGVYNALFILPKTPVYGFKSLTMPTEIKIRIEKNFPRFLPVLDTIIHALLHNPEGYFTIVRADTWYQGDFLALVGDSAHGMFPFYGQGTSAAIADAEKLGELIDIYGANWEKIFPLYQAMRKPHTDVLAALSIENFERYQSAHLIIKNKIESILHAFFPKFFLPLLFTSVSSDPTHAAGHLSRYKKQEKILNFLGFPLLVKIITRLVFLQEELQILYHKLYKAN